jgi:photosystem II stability/assembly factor-like uncharacterized protein
MREPVLPAHPAPHATPYDSSVFSALKWREIGPFRGGRSVAVAGSVRRPLEYWMGTVGGGVFKTTDGGQTWLPMTDKYFGGTIGSVAVSETNPDIVYVGGGEFPMRGNVSHGDGVWKTTDGGKTWTSLGLAATQQISRVRVHPTDPNIVYVGGGEFPMRGNVSHGDGVWKTTDGGKTWTSLGLAATQQISRVRVHPTDPNIVYVAAQGHVWGPNPERGIFKSTDGGKNWKKILFRNDSTGAADLVMDPSNPNVLYAAFWQAGRTPWMLVSGGAGGGMFKSTDAGETWTELTRNPGLPHGLWGNIGISVSPVKTSRVWAIIENDSGGVFRSDDGGATWTRTNAERKLRQRAWYYSKIHADSKDTNVVYVNNVSFQKSTDGGKTFRALRPPHGDSHDFWIAANDNQRMIEANDGGANVSVNGGRVWTDQDFATAQFYHLVTTNHFPYRVCGAQQDNSTLCGPSRNQGGIDRAEWYDAGGGESGYIAVRQDDPDIMYAGSYGGLLTRKDARTGFERNVNPWPDNPMGHSAEDLKFRFQWTFPIMLSPHDPNTLYAGANVVFKSNNEGESWTAISPDLTRHDPRTLGASGGPITKDQTSVEYYGTIFSIAESPVARGTIWAGSDDGLIHVTRDAGKTWSNVTPPDLPEWMRISSIEPGHFAAGTAYVAGNRFQLEDMTPYLYKTTDYGKTWKRIITGIGRNDYARVLREDPVRPGLLYAGTERGVYVSFDDGTNWQRLQLNLPLVPVHDLAVKEGDLVAATHGRSFWIMDDLSALRQITPAIATSPSHLFQPRDAYRVQWGGGSSQSAKPTGANPASGAVVYYWLQQPNRTVTMEFLDAKGAVIRRFTSRQDSATAADSLHRESVRVARGDSLRRAGLSADSIRKLEMVGEGRGEAGGFDEDAPRRATPAPRVPNKAGLNMFSWNMRYPDATSFDGMIFWAGGTNGPQAPPGTYSVRMLVDGQASETRTFRVLKDPRAPATLADLQEQFALLVKIRDRTSAANDAVRTIRNVKVQATDRKAKAPATDAARIAALADSLSTQLSAVEQEIYQVKNQSGQDPLNYPIRLNNKIAALSGVVSSADAKPTAQSYVVFTELSKQLDTQLTRMHSAMNALLPRLNAALRAAGLPEIVPSTIEADRKPIADDDDDEELGEHRKW